MNRIKSTNPLKPAIVNGLRTKGNLVGGKVTNVYEKGGLYFGTLHKHVGNRKYTSLGEFSINTTEVLPIEGSAQGVLENI